MIAPDGLRRQFAGGRGRTRTDDLKGMNLTSYRCSTLLWESDERKNVNHDYRPSPLIFYDNYITNFIRHSRTLWYIIALRRRFLFFFLPAFGNIQSCLPQSRRCSPLCSAFGQAHGHPCQEFAQLSFLLLFSFAKAQ